MGARFLLLAVLIQAATVVCEFPHKLTLERAFPTNHGLQMAQLRARDRARHARMLHSTAAVVDFPVAGTYDPFLVGLYYTRVQLGNPPKDFYVQIDTGSDVLWVSCTPCNGCPQTSGLQIQLNFFDPVTSTTASLVRCSDQLCALGVQSSDSACLGQTNQCAYVFQYGDGSGTSGYYVFDTIHLDVVAHTSEMSNSSALVMFGCSTSQTGDLMKSDRAVDGIFGFGQHDLSVISQLSSRGIAPKMFSHCLRGDDTGGGILVLGEIVEPNVVYTPLVPSQPHYNLNLHSISVNGQVLPINPAVFATSNSQGTIIDSGTTLAYLAEEAYNSLAVAITNMVPQLTQSTALRGNQCYITSSSISDIFPEVSFNFAGGASLVLKPQDYLIQQNTAGGSAVWCVGFQKIPGQEITILGDLVLKDKIFIYDLVNQRIGWTNYDCSTSVNVSTASKTGKSEFVNAGQLGDSGCVQNQPNRVILHFSILVWFVKLSISSGFLHLESREELDLSFFYCILCSDAVAIESTIFVRLLCIFSPVFSFQYFFCFYFLRWFFST